MCKWHPHIHAFPSNNLEHDSWQNTLKPEIQYPTQIRLFSLHGFPIFSPPLILWMARWSVLALCLRHRFISFCEFLKMTIIPTSLFDSCPSPHPSPPPSLYSLSYIFFPVMLNAPSVSPPWAVFWGRVQRTEENMYLCFPSPPFVLSFSPYLLVFFVSSLVRFTAFLLISSQFSFFLCVLLQSSSWMLNRDTWLRWRSHWPTGEKRRERLGMMSVGVDCGSVCIEMSLTRKL